MAGNEGILALAEQACRRNLGLPRSNLPGTTTAFIFGHSGENPAPETVLMRDPQLEMITLADYPEFGKARIQLNKHIRLTGTKFVDGQNTVRDRLEDLGRHRLGDVMTATAIIDIIDRRTAV